MKITKNNSIQIQGNCTNFPGDTYDIEIREHSLYVGIYDEEYDLLPSVVISPDEEYDLLPSVVISPEDAIQIAEQILNFYKGGSK